MALFGNSAKRNRKSMRSGLQFPLSPLNHGRMQKVVLVGLGFMGAMHVESYRNLADAQLVGVVDGNPDGAREALARLKIDVPVFSDLAAALESLEVNVVDVCVTTDAHLEYGVQALEAGKHLFVEKPFATRIEDAQRMIDLAAEKDLALQVGHCIRFWPEYIALEKAVRSGEYGALRSLTLTRRASRPGYSFGNWLNDEKRSLGAAVDLHIHDTDYVLHLLGKPKAVTSRGTRDRSGWDHIITLYDFDDVLVSAEGGWNYPEKWGFQMAFQAILEKATIDYDSGASPTLMITTEGGTKAALPFDAPAVGESAAGGGNVSSLGGYFNELEAFIATLEKGAKPTTATGEQAMQSLQVVLAELKSAAAGGKQIAL